MFGTWVSEIQADLRKQFPATKDYKPVDFKNDPMPVSVGHFLDHALKRRAAMIQATVDSAWFDVSDQAVLESEQRWREALAASARYPAALWGQSIDQAVSHVVSFLVTPADSFCSFAFANVEGNVHPRTVLQRLVYFGPYSALREVIKGWAERKGSELIEREDLRAAILKADRSIVSNYEPSDWIALLRPLYDLAAVLAVGNEVPEVPTAVLKPVLEAKSAAELVRRIEAIESIGGKRKLTESSLLTVLGPTQAAPVAVPVARPVAARVDKPVAARVASRNDMHSEPSKTAVPRWMKFTSKVKATGDVHSGDGGVSSPEVGSVGTPSVARGDGASDGTPMVAPPPEKATTETEGIPMPSRLGERAVLPDDFISLASTETHQATSPETDPSEQRVLHGLNPVQRAWFVNELFGGDQHDFRRVVSLLDTAEDWEAAAHVIGMEVFERYNVDIYSQSAIEFTNVVESRYQ